VARRLPKASFEARFQVKVLIVEDETDVALSVEDAVLAAGCAVTGVARTVAEAIELAAEADVALVDVRLADGLTGPSLAERLSEQFSMGVVFVTGSPEFVSQAEIGIPVVLKPVTSQSVAEALKQAAMWREQNRRVRKPPASK
jgi:DNA-binding NtrC family response regulator